MEKLIKVDIQINGVDTVCEGVQKLGDCFDQLDKKVASSQLSTLLSGVFSDATKIMKTFGSDVDKLVATAESMKNISDSVAALQDTNKKATEEAEKAAKKTEKGESKAAAKRTKWLKDQKADSLESIQVQLAVAEDEKKLMDEKVKRYGEGFKYTTEAANVYAKYYALIEEYYKRDSKAFEEKAKKDKTTFANLMKEKAAFEAAEQSNEKAVDNQAKKSSSFLEEKGYGDEIKSIKHLSDYKKEVNIADVIDNRLRLKEVQGDMKEHDEAIKSMNDNMIVHRQGKGGAGLGYTDLGKSRENLKALEILYKENIDRAMKSRDAVDKIYEEELAQMEEGSAGYIALNMARKKAWDDANKSISAMQNSMKKNNNDYFDAMANNVKIMHGQFDKYYSAIGSLAKSYLANQVEGLKEDLEDNKKILDEKTKAYAEHKSKVESLEKESEKASGGRALVLQEQIAREMQARDESLAQQKAAEKEKEEIEKQIKRKEKQQKKIEKVQEIAKATADQAMAIIAAYKLGPIIGTIMAALVGAATGVQIATIKRQWDNFEDGGLLRGKRHSQGGMKIEGTNIEVEGDEFVVNRESTRKNMGLINFINKNRRELTPTDIEAYYHRSGKESVTVSHQIVKHLYEDGGILTNLDVIDSASAQSVNDKMLEAIERINFQPVVSIVDIVDAQNSITELREIVGA